MFRIVYTVVVSVMLVFASPEANAEPLGQDFTSSAEKFKSKEERDAEIAEAEAEAEANKDQFARVIILRWPGMTTDHKDLNLQRNVRSAIGKSDALFLPAIDLYQDGREIKDTTLAPEMQPAKVSDDNLQTVLDMIERAKRLQYEDADTNEWLSLGLKYRKAAEEIWFVDRPELREPLFTLYTEIGRAADYMSENSVPLFEGIGGRQVNYYFYLAASMAYYEPELLQKIEDPETQGNVEHYVNLLQRGVFPSMKVDFQMEDKFNKADFAENYEVLINGLPVELDENGELDVFLGRSDILLKRQDEGMGLSERYEATKTEGKAYRVLEVARKRMEVDFVRQLFLYENECTPQVDGDILTYLSIYAKLHPKVQNQIYIAVPKAGNPNKVWVWRFDTSSTTLSKVASGDEEFPVHFVATMGSGALYNGATVAFTAPEPDAVANGANPLNSINPELIAANMPIAFDLRAHYTKFMLQVGIEFGLSLNDEGWTEYYQTPSNGDADVVTVELNEECMGYDTDDRREGSVDGCNIVQEVYHTSRFSQNRYIGAGYLFGRDASFGYGLRTGVRFGWMNMPYSYVTTAHLGYTQPLELFEVGKRIRPVVDADIRVGTVAARQRSLAYDLGTIGKVEPTFGFVLTAGSTF